MATNPWARFRRLVPSAPMVIVTVASVATDGTSMVTTAAGGTLRVFGDAVAAGDKAYIRDGIIIGEAPNMTHYELEA